MAGSVKDDIIGIHARICFFTGIGFGTGRQRLIEENGKSAGDEREGL